MGFALSKLLLGHEIGQRDLHHNLLGLVSVKKLGPNAVVFLMKKKKKFLTRKLKEKRGKLTNEEENNKQLQKKCTFSHLAASQGGGCIQTKEICY